MKWRGTKAGLKDALRRLPAVLAGREPDPMGLGRVFWGFVGNAVLRLIRSAFKEKMSGRTGSDGIKWAKLAAATLAIRQRNGRTDRDILFETGALLASLEPGADHEPSGALFQVFRFEPGAIVVGTTEPKADWHQNGTEFMPRRPVVTEHIPTAWEPAVERAMEKGMKAVIELVVANGGM